MRAENRTTRAIPRKASAVLGAGSLLGVLVALGGCAVGPDFKKPEATVAEHWQPAGDPRVTNQTGIDHLWWRVFNDPALAALVEIAYRQNLPLQVAGLRIVEARAQLGIAIGMEFPQQQAAVGSATVNRQSVNASDVAVVDPSLQHFNNFQLGFDVAWEIDFWGKYRRGVQAEAASMLASITDYYAALVSLSAEVARTYVMIRQFEVQIELGKANAKLQEDALAIAESRFRNGATSELDPVQAATLLESTRATIPQLQAQLQRARNALSTLLGRPSGAIEAMLAGPKEIPKAPLTVAIGVPAEMLRRRPDIQSAELNAAAQCARIGVAKAALYPSFSLLGSIGLDSTKPKNFFSGNSFIYSFGPSFYFPIFNYGRLTNAVRVEDARFQQLLVTYRSTVLNAAQEVEDALAGFLNDQETLVHAQSAVTSSQKAVQLALVQYQEGSTDFERVLDAQRALLQQQNSVAQTSASLDTNVIAVYKALGGGWEISRGQPIVEEQAQREMKERTNWGHMLSPPKTQPPMNTPPAEKH